jgi:hypothetical protein
MSRVPELRESPDMTRRLFRDDGRVAQLLAAVHEEGIITLKMDDVEEILSEATDMKQAREFASDRRPKL